MAFAVVLTVLGAFAVHRLAIAPLRQRVRRLEEETRSLAALRRANLDISGELSLDVVFQKIVDQARRLIGTRYGALLLLDGEGRVESFVSSGMDAHSAHHIGRRPAGAGLLGVPLSEGQGLRLDDLAADPRAAGFPAHHPKLRSLLAVPIICRGPRRGKLYLSEKLDDSAFSDDDEATLAQFAAQAAIAVDNADLHGRAMSEATARERRRIAREMHDGQAQVLAYVIAKGQAAQQLLATDRAAEARRALEQIVASARDSYANVREGILALRSVDGQPGGLGAVLRHYAEHWREQSGLALELRVEDCPPLGADVELQLMRIAQEALANVRKHARAATAVLELTVSHGRLRLAVEDDGIGLQGRGEPGERRYRRPRFGLATMRERADAVGATLTLGRGPLGGTRVEAEYTLDQPAGVPHPEMAQSLALQG